MQLRIQSRFQFLLFTAAVLFCFCEYFIYYVVISQCSWPDKASLNTPKTPQDETTNKIMFLADTHLLGNIKGHWFDKLRREWQMHRAFRTAIRIFQPEAVFFLGDVFDEGMWVSEDYFKQYVSRFKSMFSAPNTTKIYVIAGNHDIGFHYVITPYLHKRFEKAFNTSSVRLVRLKESNFVLVNSMAMQRDGCFLCGPALKELNRISKKLTCERSPGTCAPTDLRPRSYSRPILLQHFPLYRKSDKHCSGDDSAPNDEKNIIFRQNYDSLSNSSSQLLLDLLKPRLIISGHTHHYCVTQHKIHNSTDVIMEYSTPSFSWRNRNNPSFFLGVFTKDDYRLSKCYIPQESTIISLYFMALVVAICVITRPLYFARKLFHLIRIGRL